MKLNNLELSITMHSFLFLLHLSFSFRNRANCHKTKKTGLVLLQEDEKANETVSVTILGKQAISIVVYSGELEVCH
jgi:hypothetical protein